MYAEPPRLPKPTLAFSSDTISTGYSTSGGLHFESAMEDIAALWTP
jgi:hypothetical protein